MHPIAEATQVGHILRAAACAARVAELNAAGDPAAADDLIDHARQRATPVLIDVLSRYPLALVGKGRVAQLMSTLDAALRADPRPKKDRCSSSREQLNRGSGNEQRHRLRRVSTLEQNAALQVDALTAAAAVRVFTDYASGAAASAMTIHRTGLWRVPQ